MGCDFRARFRCVLLVRYVGHLKIDRNRYEYDMKIYRHMWKYEVSIIELAFVVLGTISTSNVDTIQIEHVWPCQLINSRPMSNFQNETYSKE